MAVKFNGDADYISCPNGGGLNNSPTYTIAFLAKWEGTQDAGFYTHQGAICCRQKNGAFTRHIIALDNTNPALGKIKMSPYAINGHVVGSTAVGDGTWRNVVVTCTSGAQEIFLDGVSDGTGDKTGTGSNDTNIPLTIGGGIDDIGSYMTGKVSFFAAWNVVLTDEEVALISKSKVKGIALQIRPASLVNYYALDDHPDGTTGINGLVFKDQKGGNDGTGVDADGDSTIVAETILSYAQDIGYVDAQAAAAAEAIKRRMTMGVGI